MVAQPDLPGRRLAPGHEASAASSRPTPAPAEPETEAETVAEVAEETATAEGTAVPVAAAPTAAPSSGGLPRWLLLLLGAASATVAVAGLREISWLVAP